MADELNVRIFSAEIIYHLFIQFSAYMNGKWMCIFLFISVPVYVFVLLLEC